MKPFHRAMKRGALALALALAACASAAAAQTEESGGYVATLGADTVSVEKFTRTAGRLTGTVVSRSPRTTVRTYTATLRPDGSVSRLEMTTRPLGGNAPAVTSVAEFTADSAIVQVTRNDSTTHLRLAAAHALPLVGGSYALYEQGMMHARALRADSLEMRLVPVGANQTYAVTFRAVGADSMTITNIAGRQRVATDARGRLMGLNGLESTQKVIVVRVPSLDPDAVAAEFARRDAAGQAMGTLSPRDSAVAHIGSAHVAVDYGRPQKRGRTIFGQVVPWGEVWRTGANAATGFTTSRDLVIGGTTVPAGSYTLWTLPTRSGWKLIVNKQTGQWGTEYDASQDLARIGMQTRRVSPAVEAFTIRVEPQGSNGGVLRLTWDDLEAFVPFTVR